MPENNSSSSYPYKKKSIPEPTGADIARFDAALDKTSGQGPNGECWTYSGYKNDSEYGVFGMHGQNFQAHRVAYRIATGIDPLNQVVMHSCDFPPCCRGEHLSAGTQVNNAKQSTGKSRNRGAIHGRTNLTDEQVMSIRLRRAAGEGLKTLAAEFGVTVTQISNMCSGKSWKHLPFVRKDHRTKLTSDKFPEVVKLSEQGWSQRAIGKHFGVDSSRVCQILQRIRAASTI